ncbi:MAG: hypothetical protein QF715_02820 [Pseudomonadales bacterium]|nr:hypothetical protein [Pseudomonadales bacterium]MDP7313689.1 hypothetical protein [Pseudomonadales bacterium]
MQANWHAALSTGIAVACLIIGIYLVLSAESIASGILICTLVTAVLLLIRYLNRLISQIGEAAHTSATHFEGSR